MTLNSSTTTPARRKHTIAVIPGDGIGKEVMPEGLRVLEAAARRFGIELAWRHVEWASCDYYQSHGTMMRADWKSQLADCDAIYFGAAGWPDTVPDHVSLCGSLLKFRREFDQYINLRPVRLFEGVPATSPDASPATSTSSSSARTPRANTPIKAAASSRAPSGRW